MTTLRRACPPFAALLLLLIIPVPGWARISSGWDVGDPHPGVTIGWFLPSDPDSYGQVAYAAVRDLGDVVNAYGLARPKGHLFVEFFHQQRWDNGLGLELRTRTPYFLSAELVDLTGPNDFEYRRIVWPMISASGVYTLEVSRFFAAFVGGGAGGVFVNTHFSSGFAGDADSTEVVPSWHAFGGMNFEGIYFRVRFDRVAPATGSFIGWKDGGNLGGWSFSIGGIW